MQPVLQGRYKIKAKRGTGPVGAVYEAIDGQTGETVAVKILNPSAAQDARLLAAFHAPNAPHTHQFLPATLDQGIAGQYPYRITPYIGGPHLKDWLAQQRKPLSPQQALAIVAQITNTLHENPHGNLKPSNILIEGDKQVRLTDAKLPSSPGPYTAPEVTSRQEITPSADVYSMGMILFEAWRGQDLPEVARHVLIQATQPDPNDRYPTLVAFYATLDIALEEHLPPTAKPARRPLIQGSRGLWTWVTMILLVGIVVYFAALGLLNSDLLSILTPGPTINSQDPTTAALNNRIYPTLSPEELANTYWDGDGSASMWDRQLSNNTYPRFTVFPVYFWFGTVGDTMLTVAQEAAVWNAVDEINLVVPIVWIENREFAHIILWLMNDTEFEQYAACDYIQETAGCTATTFSGDGTLRVEVWLRTSDTCFDETVLHELTHGLGVSAHSPYPEDIMYYRQTCGEARYSERDINTLWTLYNVAPPYIP